MKLFSPLVKTFLRLMIFKTKSRLRSPLNSIFPRLHHPWPRLNGRSPGFRKTALPSMSWSCLGHTSSFLLSPSPDYSILIHGSCSTLYFRKTGLPVTPRRGGQSARVCASKEHSLCLSLDLSQSLFLCLFHITHILLSSICVSVVPQAYEVRDMLHLLRLHLVASNKAQIPWLNQIGVFFFLLKQILKVCLAELGSIVFMSWMSQVSLYFPPGRVYDLFLTLGISWSPGAGSKPTFVFILDQNKRKGREEWQQLCLGSKKLYKTQINLAKMPGFLGWLLCTSR